MAEKRVRKVEVCLDSKLAIILGCFLLVGCQPSNEEEGAPSTEPKSSYGQAVKRARDLQAPSGAEQEKREQEADLLQE